ncbi:MAG: nucleotidyl transferase AbiEii/AbiGii toxin family protein [Desulfobacteraceae bacterium]|nr:nucleotidyl transferase AbiEii/AbiGii toxin family protein [Desulfobacteraceae bacterium]MBC2755590.1 nucleotidyl transferase AbiEii/AbiGii toxin family protein [Desulfobacteraceae bacterium]
MIAEKYRAILQQEKRNRFRRQDIFDLYYLFNNYQLPTRNEKRKILKSLIKKSESRQLQVNQYYMVNKEIIRRSKKEYPLLAQEIIIELPDFDIAYAEIQSFYESLPWGKIN